MRAHGEVTGVGIDGTGTYGRGLLRHLTEAAVTTIEVERPNRQQRATHGKSDAIDAYAAAQAALADTRCGTSKTREGSWSQSASWA